MNRAVTMGTRRQFFHNNSNSSNGSGHHSVVKDPCAIFNIAILGQLGVGKSALTVKYITRRFIMEYDPTLEDTYDKQEKLDGQDILVRVMDTYDAEENNPDRYLKWAHGFLVVYSITCRNSFEVARAYLESITKYLNITGKSRAVGLVGNKLDLERYRTVTKAEGLATAEQFECQTHETAAAEEFESVETVFHDLIREISRINERQLPLKDLYISEGESKAELYSPQGPSRSRTPKIPKLDGKTTANRPTRQSTFKPNFPLFGKQFSKIFN